MKTTYTLILLSILITLLAGCGKPAANMQKYKGYPQKNPDLRAGFVNPPPGYGNVPFYWWNGDTLEIERLREQLDLLAKSATDGFTISYNHTCPEIDTLENKDGYGLYGKTEGGIPNVFSEDWWSIWEQYSQACAQKGMAVGMDDYTIGWTGNGYYTDSIKAMDKFSRYRGELVFDTIRVRKGERIVHEINNAGNLLLAATYPEIHDLSQYIEDGVLVWDAPKDKDYKIYLVSTKEGYLLHPEHGKALVNVYFDEFERRLSDKARQGMNYFFQDELLYPVKIGTWAEDFQDEFLKRKKYDIMPCLPFLVEFEESITPKIRLDYCEVLMDLAEERYFKPIYDWHADRGLMYGCDNIGRGVEPMSYIDYFRMTSWFVAPGNDAPSTGSSFIETKVSSSVTHLYDRQRTWLEAFHSMGWGSSSEWLTRRIDHHFIAGGNLVCLHGLYYSTHGGWWEWAPPCFHFRMPYWEHMKSWLKYAERMSYVLSQGEHVCDVVILYPTEPVQAYNNDAEHSPSFVFNFARKMSYNGVDYDFVDYRSLRNSKIKDKELYITNEKYKVMVLADMCAIQHSSLQKVLDFYREGGIVLATGRLPEHSNEAGKAEVDEIVKELFGVTASELANGQVASRQTNNKGGIGWYIAEDMHTKIPELITADFRPDERGGKVLHRRSGDMDIYMVTDVEKDSECFFRSLGKVELWDAFQGTMTDYPVIRQTEEGTYLRMNKEMSNSYLLVFSPGEPSIEGDEAKDAEAAILSSLDLNRDWNIEFLPTLNNKWGDFRFPAFDGYIGAEARSFRYFPAALSPEYWTSKDFDDSSWSEELYGYGPQFLTKDVSVKDWVTYSFSWQYGVWDNPGSQGAHGLKGKVSDRFIILNKGGRQEFKTFVYSPKSETYYIAIEEVSPDEIWIDGKKVDGSEIALGEGWHTLQLDYKNTNKVSEEYFNSHYHDRRGRSAVVLYPKGTGMPMAVSPYAKLISMKWEQTDHLRLDPYGGKYDMWNYRFGAVPGMEGMEINIYGELKDVWVNGAKLPEESIKLADEKDGISTYNIILPDTKDRAGSVALAIQPSKGCQGTLVFADVVKFKTGKGQLDAGDWSAVGSLKYYSGGMYYRKTIDMPDDVSGKKVFLNLGKVVATCEVKVNGRPLGILISSPYEVDVSDALKKGDNEIEVLVYSTLSNHYQSIPSPYRGTPEAGIIGPVSLSVYER